MRSKNVCKKSDWALGVLWRALEINHTISWNSIIRLTFFALLTFRRFFQRAVNFFEKIYVSSSRKENCFSARNLIESQKSKCNRLRRKVLNYTFWFSSYILYGNQTFTQHEAFGERLTIICKCSEMFRVLGEKPFAGKLMGYILRRRGNCCFGFSLLRLLQHHSEYK